MTVQPDTSDLLFRASVVGASEVAALFGASPYLTHFELWHRKKGSIAVPEFNEVVEGVPADERIYWGVKLEAAIIAAAFERYGYTDREQLSHLTNGRGLGGHPDRRVICPERGPGLLEVKCVDWLIRKGWGDEPPLSYLLQSNTNQGLDGVTWGDVLVLVGGNKLERFQYDFRPAVFAETEARVAAFWESIEADEPPQPDFARDYDTLVQVLGEPSERCADLRHDNHADDLARECLAAKADIKAAELRLDVAKCELLLKIGDAGSALLGTHRVGCNQTKGSPDKEITADMVGTTIKGRKGYRRFDVKGIA